MKKPKFVVCYPSDKVKSDAEGKTDGQQKTFYDNLKIVLDDMGYENEFIHLKYKIPETFNGDICLCFHTNKYKKNNQKNVWHCKDGSLHNFWEFDNSGWAGWSEMATSEKLFKESQLVDLDQATEFFDIFSKQYIQRNISKYEQPTLSQSIKADKPYIFFPGQILQDSVMKNFAKINPNQHAMEISKQLNTNGYGVVFKSHPGHQAKRPAVQANYPGVIPFSGSIHDVIPNSSGIVCINSGVGFEALLYKKHVFVSGVCDYHWVAHKIYSINDIKKIPKILKTAVDEEKIIKFVYYMLTEVYVDATNLNSIRKKLKKVVKAYEDGQ